MARPLASTEPDANRRDRLQVLLNRVTDGPAGTPYAEEIGGRSSNTAQPVHVAGPYLESSSEEENDTKNAPVSTPNRRPLQKDSLPSPTPSGDFSQVSDGAALHRVLA